MPMPRNTPQYTHPMRICPRSASLLVSTTRLLPVMGRSGSVRGAAGFAATAAAAAAAPAAAASAGLRGQGEQATPLVRSRLVAKRLEVHHSSLCHFAGVSGQVLLSCHMRACQCPQASRWVDAQARGQCAQDTQARHRHERICQAEYAIRIGSGSCGRLLGACMAANRKNASGVLLRAPCTVASPPLPVQYPAMQHQPRSHLNTSVAARWGPLVTKPHATSTSDPLPPSPGITTSDTVRVSPGASVTCRGRRGRQRMAQQRSCLDVA